MVEVVGVASNGLAAIPVAVVLVGSSRHDVLGFVVVFIFVIILVILDRF
jgi:hypothetical protein